MKLIRALCGVWFDLPTHATDSQLDHHINLTPQMRAFGKAVKPRMPALGSMIRGQNLTIVRRTRYPQNGKYGNNEQDPTRDNGDVQEVIVHSRELGSTGKVS